MASILLMDETGTRIQNCTAPSLPDAYNLAIHGATIGAQAGSVRHRRVPPQAGVRHRHRDRSLWEPIAIWRGRTACAPAGHCPFWPPTGTSWVRRPCTTVSLGRPIRSWSSWCRGWPTWLPSRSSAGRSMNWRWHCLKEPRRFARTSAQHRPGAPRPPGPVAHSAEVGHVLAGQAAGPRPRGNRQARGDEAEHGRHHPVDRAHRGWVTPRHPGPARPRGGDQVAEPGVHETGGIACELDARLDDFKLDKDVATAVFRIFQEALTNITRHANASRIVVDLALEGSVVVLEVSDDGVGLPPPRSRGARSACLAWANEPAGSAASASSASASQPAPWSRCGFR